MCNQSVDVVNIVYQENRKYLTKFLKKNRKTKRNENLNFVSFILIYIFITFPHKTFVWLYRKLILSWCQMTQGVACYPFRVLVPIKSLYCFVLCIFAFIIGFLFLEMNDKKYIPLLFVHCFAFINFKYFIISSVRLRVATKRSEKYRFFNVCYVENAHCSLYVCYNYMSSFFCHFRGGKSCEVFLCYFVCIKSRIYNIHEYLLVFLLKLKCNRKHKGKSGVGSSY